ncbi:MAG: hypothetical protein AB1813_11085 [Verrucomicrobiota bacterium]
MDSDADSDGSSGLGSDGESSVGARDFVERRARLVFGGSAATALARRPFFFTPGLVERTAAPERLTDVFAVRAFVDRLFFAGDKVSEASAAIFSSEAGAVVFLRFIEGQNNRDR